MGNFIPFSGARPSPFVNVLPSNVSPCHALSGHGSPEGVIPGNVGQRYLDLDTGDFYIKMAGTQMIGWEQFGTVGTMGVQVIG